MKFEHECNVVNAPKFWDWIVNRGGVARWPSVNLANLGASWSTPAKDTTGAPTTKPTWQVGNTPTIFTDPAKIGVYVDVEVNRFRVGIRRGSQGYTFKCTDGGSRKIRAAIETAGEGAYHVFDYDTQEAVIMAPKGEPISLAEWHKREGV